MYSDPQCLEADHSGAFFSLFGTLGMNQIPICQEAVSATLINDEAISRGHIDYKPDLSGQTIVAL